MKTVQKSIFLLLISFSCFSQKNEREKLNLVFFDKCTNNFIKPEIEIDTIAGLKNGRLLTYYIKRGDWISQAFSSTMLNRESIDTITIPKILFSFGNELHSKRWNYLICEKICEGIETDFYENGNKRIEGNFKNGKPVELKEFKENGELFSQSFYENFTLNFKRINYFNKNEEIYEYDIYENKKRKTIIRTFDKDGVLISKEIQKKYIEKRN
jgi:hypothetical protein